MISTVELRPDESLSQRESSKASPSSPKGKRFLYASVWTLIAGTVLVCLLELGFRAMHVGEDQVVTLKPVVGHGLIPGKFVTWRQEGFSQGRINNNGMRDVEFSIAKPPNTVRIAMFGNSVVEALQVPLEDTFGKLIERALNQSPIDSSRTQVLNFGVSGYTNTQDYYRYLTDAVRYSPDTVLLFFHPGDNQRNLGMPGSESMPCPFVKIDQKGQLVTDWSYYDKYMATSGDENYKRTDFLRRNSRIFNVWEGVSLSLHGDPVYTAITKFIGTLTKPATVTPPPRQNVDVLCSAQEMSSIKATVAFAPMKRGPVGVDPKLNSEAQNRQNADQRMLSEQFHAIRGADEERFVATAGLISAFNRQVRKNGGRLIVVALPATNNANLYFRELRAMEKLAVAQQFRVLNLHPHFPPLAPTGSNEYFFQHNIHLTKKGHALVAAKIAEFLQIQALRRDNAGPNLPGP